jgi:succinate dehydrogenase / fumarate reductase flavoprotein subunit
MQGLADGYFVLPYTIGNYLAGIKPGTRIKEDDVAVKAEVVSATKRVGKLIGSKGKKTPTQFHRELGLIMWEHCGMGRTPAGLAEGRQKIQGVREEFKTNLCMSGSGEEVNQTLELAGRVKDFIELGDLMCLDALERNESCGGHFREDHQVEGEAKRDDENYCHVAAWEYMGEGNTPKRHVEPLTFDNVHLATRSYK